EGEFAEWVTAMGGQMPARFTAAAAEVQHGETSAEKAPGASQQQAQLGGAQGAPRDTRTTADTARQKAASAPTGPQMVYGMSPTGAPAPGRTAPQATGPVPPGTTQQRAMIPGAASLVERGQQLFTSKPCVACHTIQGTTAQGKLGPDLTRFGARRYVG